MASFMGKDNVLRQQSMLSAKEKTTLTSTDTLLASPDLFAVEWLPLAIFALFPSDEWKSDISLFSAEVSKNNTGVIWTNITADPTIYKGNQPTPGDYLQSDTAVSLTMPAYWLQPMRWTPEQMHQFRYDQMGAGWAQAFAKWGAVIDDNLLYTFAAAIASLAPNSIVNSTGQAFSIASAGAGPNKFYWNSAYNGTLASAAYNDVFVMEQLFKNQNFELGIEKGRKVVLVLDPIAERQIKQDPDTKSLLTRWIDSGNQGNLVISDTEICDRSRVAIYDPATGQVKDPNSSIPGTATGLNMAFLPDQLGIGIGFLDVFFQQDPRNYGYVASADIRVGGNLLRENGFGASLYNYGAAV